MSSLEVRSVQKGDEQGLSYIYKTVFNVHRTPSFWNWKYFENSAGEHIMKVAVDPGNNNMIVGQVGCIPVRLVLGGEIVLASQACDVVILPEYQKGGPFFKLHNEVINENINRGVQFIFGYSITRTLKISTRLLKFESVSPIVRLVQVLDPTPFIREKVKSSAIANITGGISRKTMQWLRQNRVKLQSGQEIIEVQSFDERYDDLMKSWMKASQILVYRDAAYLNWRYTSHPMANYITFAVESHGEIMGFLVMAIEDDEDMRRAYIMELIVRPPENWVYDTLVNKAIEYCIQSNVATVHAWFFKHSPMWNTLLQKGFSERETPHNLIVRQFFKKAPDVDITVAANWEISMGDSDYH